MTTASSARPLELDGRKELSTIDSRMVIIIKTLAGPEYTYEIINIFFRFVIL